MPLCKISKEACPNVPGYQVVTRPSMVRANAIVTVCEKDLSALANELLFPVPPGDRQGCDNGRGHMQDMGEEDYCLISMSDCVSRGGHPEMGKSGPAGRRILLGPQATNPSYSPNHPAAISPWGAGLYSQVISSDPVVGGTAWLLIAAGGAASLMGAPRNTPSRTPTGDSPMTTPIPPPAFDLGNMASVDIVALVARLRTTALIIAQSPYGTFSILKGGVKEDAIVLKLGSDRQLTTLWSAIDLIADGVSDAGVIASIGDRLAAQAKAGPPNWTTAHLTARAS